jgi:hypothetical protein
MMKPIVSRGKFRWNAEGMRGRFKPETRSFVKRLTARKNRRFIKQVTASEVTAFVVYDRDADLREQAVLFDWAADDYVDYDLDMDKYNKPWLQVFSDGSVTYAYSEFDWLDEDDLLWHHPDEYEAAE